ncbi:hypothetical protein ACGF12_22645 [Kitasatospora sp. NPDC048296]|uniref:hypothetical protein n=1 Tax=Kitasatospora sp. NPDC048296 TaxID=3364048 RepID=UPI00371B3468
MPPHLDLDLLLALGAVLLPIALVGLDRLPRPGHRARPEQPEPGHGPEPSAPAPVLPRPEHPPVPPQWYRNEYVAARAALGEGRTIIARIWISDLIDDCLLTFGEEHPYTRWAWELLAEITRTAIANLDHYGPTMDPHGSADLFGTVLFPKGSPYTVVRDGDVTSVYRTAGATR